MAKNLPRIHCSWNELGHIHHTILGGLKSDLDNFELTLAPSLFMLISHQLGVFQPSHGLTLCSQVLEYYMANKHTIYTINSALRGADIQYLETREGVLITFHPDHERSANDDSVEEGVRQYVNNYVQYIGSQLSGDTFLIVRAFAVTAIDLYLELLEHKIKRREIGAGRNRWSSDMPIYMGHASLTLSKSYSPEFEADADRGHVDLAFYEESADLEPRRRRLAVEMGLQP